MHGKTLAATVALAAALALTLVPAVGQLAASPASTSSTGMTSHITTAEADAA